MNYTNLALLLGLALSGAGGFLASEVRADAHSDKGYSIEDFRLGTAGDLVDVCTLDPAHEHYDMAKAFCYGFFEGATHYDDSLAEAEWHSDIVCDPPSVTRQAAVAVFVDYINKHPQFAAEPPIDGIFRALVAKWPCPQ